LQFILVSCNGCIQHGGFILKLNVFFCNGPLWLALHKKNYDILNAPQVYFSLSIQYSIKGCPLTNYIQNKRLLLDKRYETNCDAIVEYVVCTFLMHIASMHCLMKTFIYNLVQQHFWLRLLQNIKYLMFIAIHIN
jgi:hypothetical protein